jgi:hypothetical protein
MDRNHTKRHTYNQQNAKHMNLVIYLRTPLYEIDSQIEEDIVFTNFKSKSNQIKC